MPPNVPCLSITNLRRSAARCHGKPADQGREKPDAQVRCETWCAKSSGKRRRALVTGAAAMGMRLQSPFPAANATIFATCEA